MEQNTSPDLSKLLSSVMSNPGAMNMLSSLLGGMSGDKKEEKATLSRQNEKCEEKHLPPPCALPQDKELTANEKRRQLLLALKPFLSPERRQALDRILMISEALALLQSEKRL